jgi:predicted site-specific integrase-resolvase
MKTDASELISQREAAQIRGVSIQAIHELIKRGRFNTVEISGRQYLLRKEVEAFVPRRTGRPRKDSAAAKSPQASKAAKRRVASTTQSAKKKR